MRPQQRPIFLYNSQTLPLPIQPMVLGASEQSLTYAYKLAAEVSSHFK